LMSTMPSACMPATHASMHSSSHAMATSLYQGGTVAVSSKIRESSRFAH
jgi:hypothetical protein